jgi:hypothetical protein
VLIPDVKCCTVNGFEFAIEVFVTSDISADKRKLINEFRLPAVRIDLSKFYKKNPQQCRVDLAFIDENLTGLLTDVNLKSWVIPPSLEGIDGKLAWTPVKKPIINAIPDRPKPDRSSDGCLLGIITLGLIYYFIQRRKREKSSVPELLESSSCPTFSYWSVSFLQIFISVTLRQRSAELNKLGIV